MLPLLQNTGLVSIHQITSDAPDIKLADFNNTVTNIVPKKKWSICNCLKFPLSNQIYLQFSLNSGLFNLLSKLVPRIPPKIIPKI